MQFTPQQTRDREEGDIIKNAGIQNIIRNIIKNKKAVKLSSDQGQNNLTLIESIFYSLNLIPFLESNLMKGLYHECFSSGVEVTINQDTGLTVCKCIDKKS